MKQPGCDKWKLHKLTTAACLLTLVSLQSGAGAQTSTGNDIAPALKQRLLNSTFLPNGRIIPKARRRAMVPLRNMDTAGRTSPSQTQEWRNRLKSYPYAPTDARASMRAVSQRETMMPALMRGKYGPPLVPTNGGPEFRTFAGPSRINIATAINQRWNSIGPFDFLAPDRLQLYLGRTKIAGRVNNTAFDSQGNLYVATASGGLWRFDANPDFFDPNGNNGYPYDPYTPRLRIDPYNTNNPSPRSLTDSAFASLQTTSIAIDPKNDKTLYIGLGDYNLAGQDVVTGDRLFTSRQSNNVAYSQGIMKTVNTGKTWANVGNSTLNRPPRVEVVLSNPVATTTVFRTKDPTKTDNPVVYIASRTNEYVGATITFVSGRNAGQTRTVTAYDAANFQFTLGTALPFAPAEGDAFTLVGYPGLEGTAVSKVIVDPMDSRHLVASTGRGVNPGGLWYSNDAGNSFIKASWRHVNAAGNVENIAMPDGDYSDVDVSQADRFGNRVYYATRIGDGVYRSFDKGQTWSRIAGVPLVFNDPNRGGVPAGGPQLGFKVAFSRKTGTAQTVYLFDASGGFNDGRIFKSLDAFTGIESGDPLSPNVPRWIDVTGDYVRNEGIGNTFATADYDTTLSAGKVPVSVQKDNGDGTTDEIGRAAQELVVGGQRDMSIGLGGITYGGTIYGSTETGDPILRDDQGIGQSWRDIAFNFTHWFQHGVTFDNRSDYLLFSANDGGVYPILVEPNFMGIASDGSKPFYFGNANLFYQTVDPLGAAPEANQDFRISEVYRADFIATDTGTDSVNRVLVAGTMASNGIFAGDLDYTSTDVTTGAKPATDWSPVQFAFQPDVKDPFTAGFSLTGLVPDTNGGSLNDTMSLFFFNGNIPFAPFRYDMEVDNIRFDPSDPTGKTQYLITTGDPATPWGDPQATGNPYKRVYWTRDNWATYVDITPNRYVGGGFSPNSTYVPVLDAPNANGPIYLFNAMEPQDTATPTNWTGEARPYFGMPIAFGYARVLTSALGNAFIPNNANPSPDPSTNAPGFEGAITQPCMYTGGQFLWRYDPPGSLAKPATPPGPLAKTANSTTVSYDLRQRTFPNVDLGVWRRIGATQLATGNAFITAIALVPGAGFNAERIYVGTSAGDVWISRNATDLVDTSAANDAVATSNAAWRRIAGPGLAGNTLPNRPVTALRINTDPQATTLGDLVVSLGGAPGVAHVWRATNTIGAGTPIFTAVSGQGFAALPDVPVNDIVRDPDDSTNVFYAATDLGVFTTIDGGATWSNATAPLGLPNVECTSIKVVPETPPAVPGTRNPRHLYVSTFGRGIFGFNLTDVVSSNAAPNLKISQNLTRNGTEIIVNVIITNNKFLADGTTPAGSAFNVRLTSASLTAGTKVTASTSLPANGLAVGTIAPGQSQIVTVRFPATAGRSGQAVFFKAGGTLTLPPFPPGTPATFSNNPGFRTRLP